MWKAALSGYVKSSLSPARQENSFQDWPKCISCFISLFGGDVFILEIITVPTLKFVLNSYQCRSYILMSGFTEKVWLELNSNTSDPKGRKTLPKPPASICWMLVVDMVMACIDLHNMHDCMMSGQPSAQRLRCRFPYNQMVKIKRSETLRADWTHSCETTNEETAPLQQGW